MCAPGRGAFSLLFRLLRGRFPGLLLIGACRGRLIHRRPGRGFRAALRLPDRQIGGKFRQLPAFPGKVNKRRQKYDRENPSNQKRSRRPFFRGGRTARASLASAPRLRGFIAFLRRQFILLRLPALSHSELVFVRKRVLFRPGSYDLRGDLPGRASRSSTPPHNPPISRPGRKILLSETETLRPPYLFCIWAIIL